MCNNNMILSKLIKSKIVHNLNNYLFMIIKSQVQSVKHLMFEEFVRINKNQ